MFAETINRGTAQPFSLEDWIVEPQLNRVSNGEISVHLEPKAMELLLCLADHAGEVVSRRDLVDSVWTVEFVADSTLTHTVADLRKALADDARAPRFIETIPKRGYRLIAAAKGGSRKEDSGRRPTVGRDPLAVIIGRKVHLGKRDGFDLSDHSLFLADQKIPLVGKTIVFGRGNDADIRIIVPEVSRLHARLELELETVAVEDLASKNGTLVNGTPITSRHELRSGDAMSIGPITMVYRWLAAETTLTQDSD